MLVIVPVVGGAVTVPDIAWVTVGRVLVTRHPGYLLEPTGTALDLDECDALASLARQCTAGYLRARAASVWLQLDRLSAPEVSIAKQSLTLNARREERGKKISRKDAKLAKDGREN